ncbi:MAG: aspartate aminotransferase family protein [Anaerolineaceae bacterium]|nr:aspartate aminotransferase family protein [Anaerolineaceae bacterium]
MSHVLDFIDDSFIDIIKAEGCRITDSQGKTYIDFESGCWATSLGHAHPVINQVLHTQLDQVMHVGTRYPNHTTEEAAQAVLNLLDMPDGKCIFLSSGSEAVEFAVQCAKKITTQPMLLCLSQTYLAAFGTSKERSPQEWITFDWQSCEQCSHNNCQDCPAVAEIPFDQIGAFIFEPGSFSAQVKFPPAELIQTLTVRVRENGGYLVANEITTGIGRTGKWFGFQHYGVQPDIVAMGKGLGNGYPVSAVAMTCAAATKLCQTNMSHAQSHQNDPIGAAVAKTVITTIREEKVLQQCQENGQFFLNQLKQIQHSFPIIVDVRGKGLFIALEFIDSQIASDIHSQLVQRGFLTGYKPGQTTLRFFPPLNIKTEQIQALLNALQACLQKISQPEDTGTAIPKKG